MRAFDRADEAASIALTLSRFALAGLGCALLAGCADMMGGKSSDPVVDNSSTTQAMRKLPRREGERVAVTIFEFRSSVPEINGQAATDMFTTALVKSGQFAVVERQRVNQGAIAEKQMNAAGQTTGQAAQSQLRGARYIFEGTVSEANAGAKTGRTSVNVGGAQVGGGSSNDSMGVDVRIVDAHTGEILDAVNVRKALKSGTASVSGLSSLANTVMNMRGKSASPLTPDVAHESTRKESVDEALRACIESAVAELSKRFQP